ncbi:MAG: hypothetical protein R2912_11560 [Eubacteriales bacterium]
MRTIISNLPIADGVSQPHVSGAPLGRAGRFFMLRVRSTPCWVARSASAEANAASGDTVLFSIRRQGHGAVCRDAAGAND